MGTSTPTAQPPACLGRPARMENWRLTSRRVQHQDAQDVALPSLKGTDPKFRRNHRHALHGTMRALVRRRRPEDRARVSANGRAEGEEGRPAGDGLGRARRRTTMAVRTGLAAPARYGVAMLLSCGWGIRQCLRGQTCLESLPLSVPIVNNPACPCPGL